MTSDHTLPGFVARLQAKSDTDSEKLSYMERTYLKAMKRVEKREGKQWMD